MTIIIIGTLVKLVGVKATAGIVSGFVILAAAVYAIVSLF